MSDEDNYIMHPAFDFGGEELEGFWYGKFETSSKDTCNATTRSVDDACDLETLIPEIKPGVTSWSGIRVSTAFTVSQNMKTKQNEYGFNGESIDTHMSKNSEWGAVAYLSQSKYGKYGNSNYGADEKEVYINNCSQYSTGIAGDTSDASRNDGECTNTYETERGQKASTTGNITGVYDMVGGSYEYVMGVRDDGNGQPSIGRSASENSGFDGKLGDGSQYSGRALPEEKYYDLYNPTDTTNSTTSAATSCDGEVCYGHALSETVGWYDDNQGNPSLSWSWLLRGEAYSSGTIAGVFASGNQNGMAILGCTFRLVLASVKSQ